MWPVTKGVITKKFRGVSICFTWNYNVKMCTYKCFPVDTSEWGGDNSSFHKKEEHFNSQGTAPLVAGCIIKCYQYQKIQC